MNPERWRQVEQIYCSALEVEPDERENFLNKYCADDASLRNEVERLLKRHSEAENFMESPAVELAARALFGEHANGCVEIPGRVPANTAVEDPAPAGAQQHGPGPGTDIVKNRHPKHAPWWMYAVAAAFVIWTAIHHYTVYRAPGIPGIAVQAVKGEGEAIVGSQIISVTPGSPAAIAGLQAGDRILISKSDRLLSPEGGVNFLYLESGRTYRLEVDRKEVKKIILLSVPMRRISSIKPMLILRMNADAFLLILAIIVGFLRPNDISARWGALMMAISSGAFVNWATQPGSYATLSGLPLIIRWLAAALPAVAASMAGPVGLTFFSLFPRRLFHRRWIWAVVWIPAVFALPMFLLADNAPIMSSEGWMFNPNSATRMKN